MKCPVCHTGIVEHPDSACLDLWILSLTHESEYYDEIKELTNNFTKLLESGDNLELDYPVPMYRFSLESIIPFCPDFKVEYSNREYTVKADGVELVSTDLPYALCKIALLELNKPLPDEAEIARYDNFMQSYHYYIEEAK